MLNLLSPQRGVNRDNRIVARQGTSQIQHGPIGIGDRNPGLPPYVPTRQGITVHHEGPPAAQGETAYRSASGDHPAA
jgi:hypothetical protein